MRLDDIHEGLRVAQIGRDGILDDMAAEARAATIVMRKAVSKGAEWTSTGGPLVLPVDGGRITIVRGRGASVTLEGPGHPKRAFVVMHSTVLEDEIEHDPTCFATRLLVALARLRRAAERPVHAVHPAAIAIIAEAWALTESENARTEGIVSLTHPGPLGPAVVALQGSSGKKGPVLSRPPSLELLADGIAVEERHGDGRRHAIRPIIDVVDGASIDALSILRSTAALERLRNPRL